MGKGNNDWRRRNGVDVEGVVGRFSVWVFLWFLGIYSIRV